MGRRFPPGAVTLPTQRVHYERVLQLIERTPTPMTRDEFQQAFQTFIRDPESGEAYGDSWVRRTISDLDSAAVIRRATASEASGNPRPDVAATEELVTLWPTGEAFLAGEISFERFVWRSLKRGWVLEGNAPEKIEGLERVLKVLTDASGPMKKGAIEAALGDGYDYEFSSTGIRGYPNVLLLMGAITRTDEGYVTTDQAESWLQTFRRVDLFRIFERWIQREGPTGNLPRETTKRDLAKYYMYRESGGWGKQSGWLKSFWREYLDASVRNGDSARPSLSRASEYVEADNERAALRDNIREKYEGIGTDQLSGLPTAILRRMDAAETEREAKRIRAASGSGVSRSDLELLSTSERSSYTFPSSLTLYDWQQAAADQWFTNSAREPESGIAQVVTGAGKTVMALEVVRRWLDENPEGVVTVVVPTKVLMQQWLTEFVEKLNVPIEEIGWAGDGNRDSFDDGCRVLVSIVNTAVKNDFLRAALGEVGNPPHLLIADECHRYTSDVFSNVFSYPRTASLGLSATPLSTLVADVEETDTAPETAESHDGDDSLAPEDELLLDELGDIYYTLTYDQALDRGLIPPFEVNYVRFELTQSERNQYKVLSRKVSDAVSDIEARYGDRMFQLSGPYAQKLNIIMNSANGPTPAISDFFEFTQKRRELVANAVSRQAITLNLLRSALDADEQSIVFQERIEQLEQLVAPHERRGRNPRTGELAEGNISSRQELYERYPALKEIDLAVEDLFDDPKFKPVMYHSGHSRARWNDFAMEWFRDDGFANTMLSVKALIEGVDVPSADVGIIRVSSSSLRQRIQTLGRVLRTGGDVTKRSKLYVLYAKDTVDENLFKEYDWDEQLASAEINHLEWQTTSDDPLHGRIQPTSDPLPTGPNGWTEPEVPDIDGLERGDPYPGPRRGFEFSVDSDGRPFRKDGDRRKYITDDDIKEVASYVRGLKSGGTVTINKANHMLTQTPDGPVFLGVAQDPESFSYDEDSGSALTDEAPDSLDFM